MHTGPDTHTARAECLDYTKKDIRGTWLSHQLQLNRNPERHAMRNVKSASLQVIAYPEGIA